MSEIDDILLLMETEDRGEEPEIEDVEEEGELPEGEASTAKRTRRKFKRKPRAKAPPKPRKSTRKKANTKPPKKVYPEVPRVGTKE